jgi:hypothetical protein
MIARRTAALVLGLGLAGAGLIAPTQASAASYTRPPSCLNAWDTGAYNGEAFIYNACSRGYRVRVYFTYSNGSCCTLPYYTYVRSNSGHRVSTYAWVKSSFHHITAKPV